MNLVPMFILWSVALLQSGATDYPHSAQPDPASAPRPDESWSASNRVLRPSHASCPGSPGFADLGAIQGDEDDFFEGDALNFSSFPNWVFGARTDLLTHFRPLCRPGHSFDRTLPIRC
jgi:hypothetical protein